MEIVELVKCSCENVRANLNPQNLCKNLGMETYIAVSVLGSRGRQSPGVPWPASLPYLTSFRQVKVLSQQARKIVSENDKKICDLYSPCLYT